MLIFIPTHSGSVKVDKSSKGVIFADFKITQNGSYQVHLHKGTTMYVSVDVLPCQNCQLQAIQQQIDLTNQIVSPDDAGETSPLAGFRRPSYSESAPHNVPAPASAPAVRLLQLYKLISNMTICHMTQLLVPLNGSNYT